MTFFFLRSAPGAELARRGLRLALLGGLWLLALAASAQAVQTGTVRGYVRDSVTQKPIVGASVGLLGTTQGGATDAVGFFHLHVPPGDYTLVVSYLGFGTRVQRVTVRANEATPVSANLQTATLNLSEVTVTQNADLNQTLSIIGRVDRELRPVQSAQDLLRLVPGLFIAQHAGGGKAEQIFLRGFDVDHGTSSP